VPQDGPRLRQPAKPIKVKAHTRKAPTPRPRGQSLTQAPSLTPKQQKRSERIANELVKSTGEHLAKTAPKLVPLSQTQTPPRKGLYVAVPGSHGQVAFKPGVATPKRSTTKLERTLDTGVQKASKTTLTPATFTLKQVTRPYHAVAAGANAAVQGKNVGEAAKRGLQLKDTSSFSDVLKSAGVKNKTLRSVAGFGLDVALDPTTYLTAGTTSIASKAGEHAAESATRKGLTVGVRAHVPFTNKTFEAKTSGRATAKLGEQAGRVTKGKVGQTLRDVVAPVAPDVKPAYRTAAEHGAVRTAERESRAAVSTGQRRTMHRLAAYREAVPDPADQKRIIDAVEGAPKTAGTRSEYLHAVGGQEAASRKLKGAIKARAKIETTGTPEQIRRARGKVRDLSAQVEQAPKVVHTTQLALEKDRQKIAELPTNLQQVAQSVKSDLLHAGELKQSRDIGHRFQPSGPEDAQAYFPHSHQQEFAQGSRAQARAGAVRVRPSADKARGIRAPLSATHDLFSTSLPETVGGHVDRAIRNVAAADLWKSVAKVAKPILKDQPVELKAGEFPYEVTPQGLKKMADSFGRPDTNAIQRIVDGKKPGHFVVTSEKSVEQIGKRFETAGQADHLIGRFLDRTQGGLKLAATFYNPAFQPRNLIGDSILAFLGDATALGAKNAVGLTRAARAQAKFERSAEAVTEPGKLAAKADRHLNRTLHFPGGKKVTYGDLLDEMRQQGVIDTGFAGSELRNLLGGSPSKFRRSQAINTYRENLPRMATYVSAKMRGLDPQKAAEWTNFHHIDYGDLTNTERTILRRVFPFYTFFARNTRIQATKLLTRPGKFATIGKLLDETAKAAGFSDYTTFAQTQPTSSQQGLPIPIRVGGHVYKAYISPPTTDLNQLTLKPADQLRNLANRLTFYKAIPELAFNYSLFFRGPIEQANAPLVPAPDYVVALGGFLRSKLGVRRYYDKRTGAKIWGWPAKLDYGVRSLAPQANTATQLFTGVPGSRGMDKRTAALSALTGVRLVPDRPADNQINALSSRLVELTNKKDALQQRLPKDKKGVHIDNAQTLKLKAQIKELDAELGKLKVKRGDDPTQIPPTQRPKKLGNPYDAIGGKSSNPYDNLQPAGANPYDHLGGG
jgi:hypothetical protein